MEGVQSDASMSGQTHVRFTVELMPEVRRTGRMLDEPDTIHSRDAMSHGDITIKDVTMPGVWTYQWKPVTCRCRY